MHNAFAQTLNNILHHEETTWAEVFKYRVLRKIFGAKREEVTISKLEEKYKKKKKKDSEEQCERYVFAPDATAD